MKIKEEIIISVNELYPTESLASISPSRIKKLREIISDDGLNTEIFVFTYKGYYYVARGHHQWLAASSQGIEKVRAFLVDYHDLSFFSKPGNIEKTLSSIGLSTLYDFEAIGGISYSEYPELYLKNDNAASEQWGYLYKRHIIYCKWRGNMKLTIVINGAGGVGKDTLCLAVANKYYTMNVSSIDPIKEAAKHLGWDEKKDLASRKFLSDLKSLSVNYNDWPTKYLVSKYKEFKDGHFQILFVHIREGKEIDHFKTLVNDDVITLLIRRASVEMEYGNKSDDDVENYEYDYIYNNDMPLNESKEAFISFIETIIEKECKE